MRRVLGVLAILVAVVSLPAASRAAASPCAASAPMDCCAGMGDEGAPPCHCSLNRVPPAPAAQDASPAAAAVLAEAPLPAIAMEAPVESCTPAPVAPRARAAPLFLLHSVLLV